jgi:hypothetical protein
LSPAIVGAQVRSNTRPKLVQRRLVAECIAQLCFYDLSRLDLGAATGADQQVRLDGPPLRRPQGPVEVEVDAL